MLPDQLLISKVSIPGTHNSVALHGTQLARCQTKTLQEQLDMGIRFFDLRVKLKHHRLLMYHGYAFQQLDLAAVVQVLTNFLSKNPSEFIVIRIKNENKHSTQIEKKRVR